MAVPCFSTMPAFVQLHKTSLNFQTVQSRIKLRMNGVVGDDEDGQCMVDEHEVEETLINLVDVDVTGETNNIIFSYELNKHKFINKFYFN